MSDRAVGFGFLAIGAFLFATWYLTAAIYRSATTSWSSRSFASALDYVGFWLPGLAIGAAIVGALFFIRGERNRPKAIG